MTGLPRVFVEAVDGAQKVHIRWPDRPNAPATTVVAGPAYAMEHLGHTDTIPADAVELGPLPAPATIGGCGRTTETR